ncbi:hypothetical protein EGI22_09110 [Lacihabitans sp. LS3-19]|nr:hypothetical protein [Lacihabitans sp. LS3-19]
MRTEKGFQDRQNKPRTDNKGLNSRQAEVINSAFVHLLGIGALLCFCTFNPAQHQALNRYQLKNNTKDF